MSVPQRLTIDPTLPLGKIAAELPGASMIFRHYEIDYCCSGDQTLGEAAASKRMDCNELIAELAALQKKDASAAPEETEPLIMHILTRYHDVHRIQFSEMIRLARKVETVHEKHPEVPEGLSLLLREIEAQMLSHMAKEEQIIFPLMTSNQRTFARHPIRIMRFEHTEHSAHLAALQKITNAFKLPADACTTWRALYTDLRQFQDDLLEHIHLENNVLFPRFES